MACAASLAAVQSARAQNASGAQTVSLSFRYGSSVNTYVPARYAGRQFFLSLSGVFDPLQIDLQLDPEKKTASGFYLQSERKYRIDFSSGTAEVDGKRYAVPDSSFRTGELGFYVRPHLLEKLFDLRFSVSMRRVALTLKTPDTMPVEEASKRASQRRNTMNASGAGRRDYAPLLFDRRYHWLQGGVLDYSLGASISSSGESRFRYDFGGGAELLGGDIQGNLSGSFSRADVSAQVSDVRWRYVPERNPYLRAVRAGAVRSTGLRNLDYYGVQLSNEPVRFRRTFGTRLVQGETQPGWEVELYVNDRLLDYTRADELGNYSFEVPLTYGSTYMTVKIYGPAGQFEQERRRVQVPFTFVPEGRVHYTLDAGRTSGRLGRPSFNLGQVNASAGLTNWLTNEAGLEYAGGDTTQSGGSPWSFYDRVSLRFADHYIASAKIAPSTSYEASLSATLPWRASFSATYTQFAGDAFNRAGRDQRLQLRGSLPLERWGIPAYLRLNATRDLTSRGRYTYRLRPSLSVQPLPGFRARASYRTALEKAEDVPYRFQQSQVNSRFTYTIPRSLGLPSVLSGMRLSASVDYNDQQRQFGNVTLEAAQRLTRHGRLRLGYSRNVAAGSHSLRARLTLDLPYARSSTSAYASGTGSNVSQSVSGAVGYDDSHGRFVFDDQGWVGGSAASVRLFVDDNGNDRYDKGERIIRKGRTQFQRSAATHTSEAGITRAHDLAAYNRYNLEVKERTIRNPLWVPKSSTFSVVAEPNAFTSIDVPFYVGGVVQGTALRAQNGQRNPVPGLRLHLKGVNNSYQKTLPVFSDGSFYEMGVPPGTYVLQVDSTQLEALGAVSDPPAHRFKVEVTKQGDYVQGLEFVLRDRSGAGGQPADTSAQEIKQEAIAERPPPSDVVNDTAAAEDSTSALDEAASPDARARTYVVQAADSSLMGVARHVYDEARLWPKIWRANKVALEDPDVIHPGQHLRIPEKAPLTEKELRLRRAYYQGNESAQAAMEKRVYWVQVTDRGLMDVARKVYDDAFLWPKIWRANLDILPDADGIEAGMRLHIPEKASLTLEEQLLRKAYHRERKENGETSR
jgi:hypothetical protein